jgi:hypothetical protein
MVAISASSCCCFAAEIAASPCAAALSTLHQHTHPSTNKVGQCKHMSFGILGDWVVILLRVRMQVRTVSSHAHACMLVLWTDCDSQMSLGKRYRRDIRTKRASGERCWVLVVVAGQVFRGPYTRYKTQMKRCCTQGCVNMQLTHKRAHLHAWRRRQRGCYQTKIRFAPIFTYFLYTSCSSSLAAISSAKRKCAHVRMHQHKPHP